MQHSQHLIMPRPNFFKGGDPCKDHKERQSLTEAEQLFYKGDFKQAIRMARDRIQIRQQAYGKAHPNSAYARILLGDMLVNLDSNR